MSSRGAISRSFSFLETTGVMHGEVPSPFKCPICFKVPRAEVYQCKNGHAICKSCQRECAECPQCRVPFPVDGQLIRNRALEELLDTLLLSCVYQPWGCADLVRRTEMKEHSINCKYNGKSIHLCNLLGYSCEFWISTLNPFAAVCHFYQKHDVGFFQPQNTLTVNFKMCLESILATTYRNGVWKPIMMDTEYGSFMIIMSENGDDRSVSWTCLELGESHGDNKMEVEFKVESKSKGMPPLIFKIPPVPVLNSAQIIKTPIFRTPLNILKDHYWDRQSGKLKLEICIMPKSNVYKSTGNTGEVVTVSKINSLSSRFR